VQSFRARINPINPPFVALLLHTCITHTIATLLQDYCYCAQYDPPPRPRSYLLYAIHDCEWHYRVKVKFTRASRRVGASHSATRLGLNRNSSRTKTHETKNTTNDHTKEHPPSRNNERRRRGDGAYHPPRPGGWPRRRQRER